MKLYSETEQYKLYNGSMLDMEEVIAPCSIDSIVCDPPYELNFMGKGWDNSGIAFDKNAWAKCFNVLKPGGYLLAFGGSRTFHRIACAIEDAGFEIRDVIMWLYGSGFPKSLNIGLAIDKKNGVASKVVGTGKSGSAETHSRCMKSITDNGNEVFGGEYEIKEAQNEWNGWGSCLKPAYEPIIVARKPFKGSLNDNIAEYGVGGLNIDECRVGDEEIGGGTMPDLDYIGKEQTKNGNGHKMSFGQVSNAPGIECESHIGRFPSNVIHDGSEEVMANMPNTKSVGSEANFEFANQNNPSHLYTNIKSRVHYEDEGSAARYFYCAKASKKDRDEGLDKFEAQTVNDGRQTPIDNAFQRGETQRKNIHPTVKPIELMQYLVRLVTPRGGQVLDCFMGSGSTGKATMFENRERNANYKFIGIELTDEYLPICEARIDFALHKFEYDLAESAKKYDTDTTQQLNLFDIIGG